MQARRLGDRGAETCGEEGECIPYPKQVSVGKVSISGLTKVTLMEPQMPGAVYFAPGADNPGLSLENCVIFNVMGLPAISIPCGFSASGLPIGLTIAGPHFSEGKILALAHAYEQATDWHMRRPPELRSLASP